MFLWSVSKSRTFETQLETTLAANWMLKETAAVSAKSLLGKSNCVERSRTSRVDPSDLLLSSGKTGSIQATTTWNINTQTVWLLQLLESGRRQPALNRASLTIWGLSHLEALGLSHQFWLARYRKLLFVLKGNSFFSLNAHFPFLFKNRINSCENNFTVGSCWNSQNTYDIGLSYILQRIYKDYWVSFKNGLSWLCHFYCAWGVILNVCKDF